MPQADPRVLERFRAAVGGLGHIYGPYRYRNPKWQPRYSYALSGCESVQAAIAMIWKWLSPVKREQARRAILRDRAALRERAHGGALCSKGHRDWATTVVKGKSRRRCLSCEATNQRRVYLGAHLEVRRAYNRDAMRRSRARKKLSVVR